MKVDIKETVKGTFNVSFRDLTAEEVVALNTVLQRFLGFLTSKL